MLEREPHTTSKNTHFFLQDFDHGGQPFRHLKEDKSSDREKNHSFSYLHIHVHQCYRSV